jgi:membrane fusion protein (multidrug efflux system)
LIRLAFNAALAAMALACGSAFAQEQDGLRARGVVRALAEASISSELAARIDAIPFREGQGVKRGEILVEFDCTRLAAEVAALGAEEAAARATHDGNREMERLRAIGARDLAISAARLDKAAAEHAAGKSKMTTCKIAAPFDAVVIEKLANRHEVTSPSAPLLRIVDVHRLEIELIAPSRWLGWVAEGARFSFKLDETGRSRAARIVRLGGAVDPLSHTIKIFATFDEAASDIWPGMSGVALFPPIGG